MEAPIVEADAIQPAPGSENRLADLLESGSVLVFRHDTFALKPEESRFVERPYSDGKSKNVNIRGASAALAGANGTDEEQAGLRALLIRYRGFCDELISERLPAYAGRVQWGGTTYRPFEVETRHQSWRQDDTRMHVDAFPSRPLRDSRILRVFANINPAGVPRVWRVGEPFEAMARKFVGDVSGYSAIQASLLAALKITKSKRSEYDHIMLQLHDRLKSDLDYQKSAPQQWVEFAPGTVWVTYSDLVMHAAMSGQYMLEQTGHLPSAQQVDPEKSPQRIIARLVGHPVL